MPELRPFKGVRYSAADDQAALLCPPYDVISPEEQDRLYERHPHNAIRLELAKQSGDDPKRYTNAARTFEGWLADGVLTEEVAPALYVYRQDFTGVGGEQSGSRRRVAGVIGALTLEPFGSTAGVLPHERTMPGPIEDRLALLRACPVNVSPIYSIYRGGSGIAPFLDDLENRPTVLRARDDQDVLHRLWVISAPAEIEMLSAAIAEGPLVIADGHHRYETALAFMEEQKGAGGSDAIMCLCVDADAEDMVVLPYHRALRSPTSTESARESLRTLSGSASSPEDAHEFVFVFADETLTVSIPRERVAAELAGRHEAWRNLDVVALHEVVLPAAFPDGITDLRFSKDADEIRKLVADGWSAGVLMRPVEPAQIVDVARSGERMPQKASYFWPKAVTGLVFRSLT